MALAVGHAVTVGVVLEVVPPPLPPHPAAQKLARIPTQIAACRPIIFITQPLFSLSASGLASSGPAESSPHEPARKSRRQSGAAAQYSSLI
jgi:hypothetical protein